MLLIFVTVRIILIVKIKVFSEPKDWPFILPSSWKYGQVLKKKIKRKKCSIFFLPTLTPPKPKTRPTGCKIKKFPTVLTFCMSNIKHSTNKRTLIIIFLYIMYYNLCKPVQHVSIPFWDHHQGHLRVYKLHKLKPTIQVHVKTIKCTKDD
jgi:hypothetical protein